MVAVLVRLLLGATTASSVLRALQSVVAHDRLDAEFESEQDQVEAADEMLDTEMAASDDQPPR